MKSLHQSNSNPDAFPLFENRVYVWVRSPALYTHCREGEFVCVCLWEREHVWECHCVCVFDWGRVHVFLLQCWNKPPVMVGAGQGCFRAQTAPATSPYMEGVQKLHIFLKAKAPLSTEWVHASVWPTEACCRLRESARIAHCCSSQIVLPVELDT